MSASNRLIVIMSVVLLVVILVGFLYIQSEINGLKKPGITISPASSAPTPAPVANGHPNLVCYNTILSVAFQPGKYGGYPNGYYYLVVDAAIGNIGNVTASHVSLWIQTYFPNGTEAINYNMTLYYFWVAVVSWVPSMAPQTVSINPGQSYLVQSGNMIESGNVTSHSPVDILPGNLVANKDFLANYTLTPLYENG